MYFTCCEMDFAFEKFVLMLATRTAPHSKYFHVQSGESISPKLRNYVVVLCQNTEQAAELSIIEYRVSINDYQKVTSRACDLQRMKQELLVGTPCPTQTKHYLILANFSAEASKNGVEIVPLQDLKLPKQCCNPNKFLALLQASRLNSNLGCSNIYGLSMNEGNTAKTVREFLLTDSGGNRLQQFPEPYYQRDPIINNGMCLKEINEDVHHTESTDLGVFLIRKATNSALITHIKPIRELGDLAPSTHFVVSDTISYTELCQHRSAVHEVIYEEDYGLVYWQRSSAPTGRLRRYLSCASPDGFERRPPPTIWLKVIYSERTAGKSRFLEHLLERVRREQPFTLVALINGCELSQIWTNNEQSPVQKLGKIFDLTTEVECQILLTLLKRPGQVVMLIDHADFYGPLVLQLLQDIDQSLDGVVNVWIAAGPKLRELVEDNFPIVCHEFPTMDKVEQAECLELVLPRLNINEIEKVLAEARTCNLHKVILDDLVEYPFTNNIFSLKLIADMRQQVDELARPSYVVLDLLEMFVKNNFSCDINYLQEKCYNISIEESPEDPTIHKTVMEFLSAMYLARHPELVTQELYRSHTFIGNLLDLILSRGNKLFTAVLNNDLEQVLINLEGHSESSDLLHRNPLHLNHDSQSIGEALVTAGIKLEQTCLLSSFTPLQMADERQKWKIVDLFLKHGANSKFADLKLRTMDANQLENVLEDCIFSNLQDLTHWILLNREDLKITPKLIYTASVCNEFDQDLTFRILKLAHEQGLQKCPPYRFMWGCTALHQAAYDGRLEICKFLVEKLGFDVNLQDYSGVIPVKEASDVNVVAYLMGTDMVESTVEKKSDESNSVQSLYMKACYSDNLDLVRYTLEQQRHDPLQKENGSYGFINAAAWGSLPIVEYLFENGFRDHLDVEDGTEYTALATAVRFEHSQIVEFLVAKGADVTKIKDTPKDRKLLKFLVENCDFKPVVNFEALSELSVDELRDTGFDYATKNVDGIIFLHYYVEYHSDSSVLRYLLTKYDDFDLECQYSGRTPLHEALMAGRREFIDILLEAGADVRKRCTKTGRSVVHFAAASNNKHHLDLFLTKYKLSIDARDSIGQTIIFHLGCNLSNIQLVRHLVTSYGMDVNAQNNEGYTVLHKTVIEAGYFFLDNLEFLLRDVGVRQNITDGRGRLALHYAVEQDQTKAVHLMGRYGNLELDVKDQDGKAP